MHIKSSLSIAGNISASFTQSATALNSVQSATNIASKTNVAGNIQAQAAINQYEQGLKQLSASILSAGNQPHSVAKDFSQIDQQVAHQLEAHHFLANRKIQ